MDQIRALLVDGYHTTAAISAATWAREAGIPVIADLDVLRPGIDDLMPLVDYAFASREFPAALTGEPNLKKALAMLQEQFHCRLAGVTRDYTEGREDSFRNRTPRDRIFDHGARTSRETPQDCGPVRGGSNGRGA